jgi:hypothetical protein
MFTEVVQTVSDFFGPILKLFSPFWYVGTLILLYRIWRELEAIRLGKGLTL